jgi:hypothetical protein
MLIESYFEKFFEEIVEKANKLDINVPTNFRGRKSARTDELEDNTTAFSKYKNTFKLCVDSFISFIEDRFQTEIYKPIISIFNILSDKKNKVELKKDLSIYSQFVDFDLLSKELNHWYIYSENNKIDNIASIVEAFSNIALRKAFRNVY